MFDFIRSEMDNGMAVPAHTIVDKLKIVEEHARKLVEAGECNDWRRAETELDQIRLNVLAVSHLVEMAKDLQRGQIR